MFTLNETTAASLRRLGVLNRILSTNKNSAILTTDFKPQKRYSSEKVTDNQLTDTYVKIGDTVKAIKQVKSPEKVPYGYVAMYSGLLKESQTFLQHLKWIMQKDELRQDIFLIGSPPSAFRRNLAMFYAELTKREVEYLCLSRDTTESDIKQRREVVSGSVVYNNQCAVNAALNGRLLIIEGIEKAERNLLPILNNLLENRELNLDDGHFLLAPERYDKLVKLSGNDLTKLNYLRVHEDFRVIAIGLPIPKYKGNPLDPPLRSRFQARLVNTPSYIDLLSYLSAIGSNLNNQLIQNLMNFGYSFYQNEINSFNLPDFPLENVEKLVNILNKCYFSNKNRQIEDYINVSELLTKLYPYKLILKDDVVNHKLYFDMLSKFDLPKLIEDPNDTNPVHYKFGSIEKLNNSEHEAKLTFSSERKSSEPIYINVKCGTDVNIENKEFIMNDYHSSQLVDLLLSHASNSDICLIGPRGSGKTALIKEFAKLLDYPIKTIQLYKDMSARDLIQQRITLMNGDTKWLNSVLVNACLSGDLVVLDGIHRLRDDTLLSLKRLIQDRELELLDGTKLLRHDKFDALMSSKHERDSIKSPVLRIHPSFRIIATAEPPVGQSSASLKDEQTTKNANSPTNNWLTPEVLNLFIFQNIEPLNMNYEFEILNKKFKLNEKHRSLLEVIEKLKNVSQHDVQLKQISKLFSLRQIIRLSNKLEKYPQLELRELIENSSLYKFMPQLNKQLFNEFLVNANIKPVAVKHNENTNMFDQFKSEASTEAKSISELAKIPDTLFYDNRLHMSILNNLLRDFQLGEHILLIGNQGTGKNKLVDKFLMLMKRPREYIQLHRDTTVHSLTVQPNIKSGIVHYEDSPLVKAVKLGHVLIIDEADKAPVHVTSVLKSLIETGEMLLSDGRMIVPFNSHVRMNDNVIRTHKDFRVIILANRPGYPFLGNDFFSILGDLLSCHPIDNPDPHSEIEMLRMYAPNVSDDTLRKLVNSFGSLRELSDQGLLSYPYSTRELVNIVKHLQRFPNDPLSSVINNISDFDFFNEQSDLKDTFKQIMNKHGIPVGGTFQFNINLAQTKPMPAILKLASDVNVQRQSPSYELFDMQLQWKYLGDFKGTNRSEVTCDRNEARTDSFTELRSFWRLPFTNQHMITDMITTSHGGNQDFIYASAIRPISVLQMNKQTSEGKVLNLSEYFTLAWRTFYPRIRLYPCNEPDCVYVYEETSNQFYKLDFAKNAIHQLQRTTSLLNKAKKTINKMFIDQTQTFKLQNLSSNKEDTTENFVLFRKNSSELDFMNMNKNYQLTINFNLSENTRNSNFKIQNVLQINANLLYINAFDSNSKPNDYLLTIPNGFTNLDTGYTDQFQLYKVGNLLNSIDDLLYSQIQFKNVSSMKIETMPKAFEESFGTKETIQTILPSINHHFIVAPKMNSKSIEQQAPVDTYFCRRETPVERNALQRNLQAPVLQSIINFKSNQILSQIPLYAAPKELKSDSKLTLGYLEIVDLNDKAVRYLEIPRAGAKTLTDFDDDPYTHLNVHNEANYLLQLSTTSDNLLTLDFNGCLREWETSKMGLEKSLDEWYKMISDNAANNKLSIDIIEAKTSEEALKDLNGPKHGKVDPKNLPHIGGNTWAGGSGGRDTAGLGGVGGPYRLDSGNPVHQVSDEQKQNVPEHVKKAAREMAQKAFRERLREIQMSEYDHDLYTKYSEKIRKPVQQLRNILDGLEAKKKERQWLKHQTTGDLDDTKLVEAIVGEKNVYKKRGEDENAAHELEMEKPKRLKLVIDVSGSMYRFNGVDSRLERQLEAVLMVMEAFNGYETKIRYDIMGHSGDGYSFKFTEPMTPPKNEAERLKLLKTMIAHSQFCSSGDCTLEATKHAIDSIAKEEADDHFVIVLSDANFDRYGISPRSFSRVMNDTDPSVNTYCIFIGSLGNQAQNLKKNLPFGKAFVCMDTNDIPKIMQQIFQSAILN